MSQVAMPQLSRSRAPWHLPVVGGIALLSHCAIGYAIVSAQAGALGRLNADEAAYFSAQPHWFAALADVGLASAVVGSLALLLRLQAAVWLYSATLAMAGLAQLYVLSVDTPRLLLSQHAIFVTLGIVAITAPFHYYGRMMRTQGLLR